jgi:beta-galactosidase
VLLAFEMALAAVLPAARPVHAQNAAVHPEWPGKGQLFVGTCYQPIDRTPEEIHRDIGPMKGAGFTLVRMGDLSWDSFEPAEDRFTFDWFDKIMDEMAANGIKVILDIGGLPAPLWLHHKYPGANLVAAPERFRRDRAALWRRPRTDRALARSPPLLVG